MKPTSFPSIWRVQKHTTLLEETQNKCGITSRRILTVCFDAEKGAGSVDAFNILK
jgi:hypothetical protein